MTENKRYYWLKLPDDFFNSKRIKKLRKLAGGDTYTIIYLKMQLKALKSNGVLEFTGIEDNFANELALDIDEEPENVAITISYLKSVGLLETTDEVEYVLPYVMSGSETASTQRSRECRERQKLLHCNITATPTQQLCNVEIEKEIEKEKEKEKENICVEKKQPFITLTLNDKSEYPIYQENVDSYKELYPSVNIEQQLRNMKGWLANNPTKRKTKSGINRFINGWLAREQDKPKYVKSTGHSYEAKDELPTNDMTSEDLEKLKEALFLN